MTYDVTTVKGFPFFTESKLQFILALKQILFFSVSPEVS